MLRLLIKTLILPRIETDDLQGQVQTRSLNAQCKHNYHPDSSIFFNHNCNSVLFRV